MYGCIMHTDVSYEGKDAWAVDAFKVLVLINCRINNNVAEKFQYWALNVAEWLLSALSL